MAQCYTGLDVSMEQTDIATVNDKGKIVFEASIKTDPQSIDAALKQAGFPIQKMSLESGSWSHWLVKEISALGWNITCIDARSISPLLALKANKTDRNDARGIAEAVRMQSQYIREVYQKSQESINLFGVRIPCLNLKRNRIHRPCCRVNLWSGSDENKKPG